MYDKKEKLSESHPVFVLAKCYLGINDLDEKERIEKEEMLYVLLNAAYQAGMYEATSALQTASFEFAGANWAGVIQDYLSTVERRKESEMLFAAMNHTD